MKRQKRTKRETETEEKIESTKKKLAKPAGNSDIYMHVHVSERGEKE